MTTARLDNPVESTPRQPTGHQSEMRVALPLCRMILGVIAPMALIAAGLCVAVLAGMMDSWSGANFRSAILGAASVTAVALAGVFLMTPWKSRPVADWMTMWLGSTVFRLLVTPVVVYLLYSAASQNLAAKPLVLSVASTYFVTLLTEAVILTTHIRRSLPSA